jgi:hypothetical protein
MALGFGTLTQVADLAHIQTAAAAYGRQVSVDRNAYINSPAVARNAQLAALIAGDNYTYKVPLWKELDDTDPQSATDTSAVITAEKVPSLVQTGIKVHPTKAHAHAALIAHLASSDPGTALGEMSGEYVRKQYDKFVLAALNGFAASELALGTPVLVQTLPGAADGNASVTDAMRLNETTIANSLAAAIGEQFDSISMMVTHPLVAASLSTRAISGDDRLDGQPHVTREFLQLDLKSSDRAPRELLAGSAGKNLYTTYFLTPGSIGFAETAPPGGPEFELVRDPEVGNGAGGYKAFTRRLASFHIMGMNWIGATNAWGTLTSLATAGNWARVFAPKHMGIVAIRHNL